MNTPLPDIAAIPGERLADALYRRIRDHVMFSPVDVGRVYPHEMCERFNASPTPVREALTRLAAEGFIESIPRRGYHVRRPTPKQVIDLWQVRAGLEVLAGELVIERLVAGRLADAELDSLDTLLHQLRASHDNPDGRVHLELNAALHHRIVELSGNELLCSTYRGIRMQVLGAWVRRGMQAWRSRLQVEADDHAEIVAALRARDAARYREIARSHVVNSLRSALRDLSEYESRQARLDPAARPPDPP